METWCNSHGQDSSYGLGREEYEKNPYHEVKNPPGIIQMGLAENQLCFDLVESWLAKNPDAASFKRDGQSIFKELALFQDYHGLPGFKKALVDFMSEIRGNRVTFDPNNIVLTAGATDANETLMFCLAEQGDAFLLPTPYYPGFDRDLKWRTGVEIVPIQCSSSNRFQITEAALEEAYEQAHKQNLRVKGVLVTNPSNPLGTTMTRNELDLLINFVSAKEIHLISDETYSGTVFRSPAFVSIIEVLEHKKLQNSQVWERVHVVYSLSKHLDLPGFRVGAIHSNDPIVVAAAPKMSSFGLVSSQTQYLLSALLSDKKFTKEYISKNHKRLSERQSKLVSGLENAGISCLESNAGLFCWVDMRHLLSSNTFEAEMELWKKIVYDVRLNISPGSSCHCIEPGWFRVCFANMSEDTLEVAIQRLKSFVNSMTFHGQSHQELKNPRRRPRNKWVFQLPINQNTAADEHAIISMQDEQQTDYQQPEGALDVEQPVSRRKINKEQILFFLAIINFLIEIPALTFEQISSKHKPMYALMAMIFSFMATLLIIIELVYGRSPRNKRFGKFPQIVGLVCSILQSIVSAIIYGLYLHHADYPIKISFWPIIFSTCLLWSKLMENQNHGHKEMSRSLV